MSQIMEIFPSSDMQHVVENNKQVKIAGKFMLSEQGGSSSSDVRLEGQMWTGDTRDIDHFVTEQCFSSENIDINADANESDRNPSYEKFRWLESDEPVALWVKWRGRWQTGIRCGRADWPLHILKAKPTNEMKKYCVVFLPHSKIYFWADMTLVKSINEFPDPILYKTHKIGQKMVEDLAVPQQHSMKLLAFGILSILDRIHFENLVDTARSAKVWNDFAVDLSHCESYSDIGGLLPKLQSTILSRYMDDDWTHHSHQAWIQRCATADSAETVEVLRQEFLDALNWSKINSVKIASDAEWKTWKHDLMKLFLARTAIPEQDKVDGNSSVDVDMSRKRPKLEVRRADAHGSLAEIDNPGEEMVVDIDSEFFNQRDTLDPVVDNNGNKSQQCVAFIESKGRQCVRWANEGDLYCCVHLTSRLSSSSGKPESIFPISTQPCSGTTVHGTRCKHRSLPGTMFCKKHRSQLETFESVNHGERRTQGGDTVVPEEVARCISNCNESPKHYNLYCDKHIPSWLKRARNGRARIISKEVFTDILRTCNTSELKSSFHEACELFYKFFKTTQSVRNPVPMDVHLDWALKEASKRSPVGELLLKLVLSEKARLVRMWGLNDGDEPAVSPPVIAVENDDGDDVKCKICLKEFADDHNLGNHFMEIHKEEAEWFCRVYACAICLDSFTNKVALETHVQERHHVTFVEQCVLLQCNRCHTNFGNTEELWLHALAVHPAELRLTKIEQKEASIKEPEVQNIEAMHNFACKFCGMKFDYLPDLGRHHQTAHLGKNLLATRPQRRGVHHFPFRLKSQRRFKKVLGVSAYRMKNSIMNEPSLPSQTPTPPPQPSISYPIFHPKAEDSTGAPFEVEFSAVAKEILGEIVKTNPRPSNYEILAVARASCCTASLKATLEGKYGALPERFLFKAAKLCSEHSIQVEWHREGFVCPRGCRSFQYPKLFSPAIPRAEAADFPREHFLSNADDRWKADEFHYLVDSNDLRDDSAKKTTTLCHDVSSGKEATPVACVADEDAADPSQVVMPWECFEYITRPIIRQSEGSFEGLHLGCSCSPSGCSAPCDHAYLFDNDYRDPRDLYGKSMHGQLAYDDKGRIVLEEGYVIYECNARCSCSTSCVNRVLQRGVRLKLEIFMTDEKGWGVRAGEPILRGMFVCEFVGEVIDDVEANRRRARHGDEKCVYMLNVSNHLNDVARLLDGEGNYVIDATNHGNVARFINHSCASNLVNYQVIIDSMAPQRAHIGLYACRDIVLGEELTFNYRDGRRESRRRVI